MRVYSHLLLAVGAFVAFETVLFSMGAAEAMYDFLTTRTSAWLLILGAFMVVNWMATSVAHNLENDGLHYSGLFGLAAAEALIFAPFPSHVFNVPVNCSCSESGRASCGENGGPDGKFTVS